MATEKTVGAYLEITLKVNENDRAAAAAVYTKYRQPFLDTISLSLIHISEPTRH